MNQQPIFLTGLGRSGKSLLSKLLGLHPNIATHSTELRLWPRYYNKFGDLSQTDNFERCFKAMLAFKNLQAFMAGDVDYIRAQFSAGEPTYARLFTAIFEAYLNRTSKARWGDQSQAIERYADAVLANFPTAKIIHVIRDPRDRFCAYAASTNSLQGTTRRHSLYGQTNRWLHSAGRALRNQQRYPNHYKIIHYETLVGRPTETLHEICRFLDEDDIPEAGLNHGLSGLRNDHGIVEYQHISDAYVGQFHEAMSPREIAYLQLRAAKAMTKFHYTLAPVQLSLPDRLRLYLVDWPLDISRRAGQKIGRTGS